MPSVHETPQVPQALLLAIGPYALPIRCHGAAHWRPVYALHCSRQGAPSSAFPRRTYPGPACRRSHQRGVTLISPNWPLCCTGGIFPRGHWSSRVDVRSRVAGHPTCHAPVPQLFDGHHGPPEGVCIPRETVGVLMIAHTTLQRRPEREYRTVEKELQELTARFAGKENALAVPLNFAMTVEPHRSSVDPRTERPTCTASFLWCPAILPPSLISMAAVQGPAGLP